MEKYKRFIKFHKTFDEFFDKLNLIRTSNGLVDTVILPERLGAGSAQRIKLRPGMELIFADFELPFVQYLKGSVINEYNYLLSGLGDITQPSEFRFGISNELCYLSFFQYSVQYIDDCPISKVHYLEISTAEDCLLELLKDELPETLLQIEHLFKEGTLSVRESNISTTSQLTIQQILQNWNIQTMRKMYLEGKCLELLSLHIHEQIVRLTSPKASFSLLKHDLGKILQARDILLSQMDCPPSIKELSKLVGLNDFKLKVGFKSVFGTTVYGLLREERLEKARLLLEMDDMNVGEVAYAIGYSNASHFALAFKKKYGLNPGEIVKFANRLTYSNSHNG